MKEYFTFLGEAKQDECEDKMSRISVNWLFEAGRISWRRFSLYRRLSIDAMTGVFAVVLPNQMLTRFIQCVKTH